MTYTNTASCGRKKKYRITSKFRFIASIIIMTGLITAVFGAVSGLSVSRAITQPEYTQVEICHGDALWDIANTYKSDDTDTRRAIYEICAVNDIEASDLVPGMTISVPEDL